MSFALITGASKGIGRAIAKELASRKINVLLVSRNETLLAALAKEIKDTYKVEVFYLSLDLSQAHAAQKVFDWCKEENFEVSILINNAGYGLSGKFENYSADEHLELMRINMVTPVEIISVFLPSLKQQHKKTYILNIGSSSAYQAVPYLTMYSASKAFIVSFTRGLKYELRKTNVVVTLVSPGVTETEFTVRAKVPEKGLKTAEKISMTPEAVAKIAVKSLFKEKAEVITGFLTKLTVFFVWLLPKKISERTGAGFYQ